MGLVLVNPQNLPDWWCHIEAPLAAVCGKSGGKFQTADVARAIATGEFDLWLVTGEERVETTVVGRRNRYPRLTSYEILACSGEKTDKWIPSLSLIEEWAKVNGCQKLEPIARPGFERVLRDAGYRKTHILLEKDL